NQIHSAFFKNADSISLAVSYDFTTFRVGRFGTDTSQLHSYSIRKKRMTAGMSQHDRVIWRAVAQSVMMRITLHIDNWRRVPFFLMPAASFYPLAWFGSSGSFFYLSHNLFPTF